MTVNAAVVVAVDGSEQALTAVRWAAPMAKRLNRVLQIVSASPTFAPRFSLRALSVEEDIFRAARAFAEQSTKDAAEVADAVATGVRTERDVIEGKPALALRQVASTAHLLVVGRRGLGGVRGLLMGSVSTDVAAHADCPVVVVPELGDSEGPVVVGVDGSPVSTAAIGRAFEQASLLDTSLTAVHAYGGFSGDAYFGDAPAVLTRLREEAEEALGSQLAGYRQDFPDVTVEPVVTTGHPAEVVNELSGRSQLAVLGSRGRGGFRGLVLGSTSQAVLQVARCPVMIVNSA